MSYYLKEQNILWPTLKEAQDLRDSLPVGTYTVKQSMKGLYLEIIEDFKITGKIYGNATQQADRILNTFKDRPHCTGVLLNGEKGSGKTLLAKSISEKALKDGISTIVINTPFCGEEFNTFIQKIDEACIVIFDEFEKVYDTEQQELILTLLDGMYPSKKMFILTVNDKYRVSHHMRNRPGRIYYMLDYKGLDATFIREYATDNLKPELQKHIDQMARLPILFDSFNFDMLKALVEEMNRYDESPKQAMEMLNAKPVDAGSVLHEIEIMRNGKKVEHISPNQIRGIPIAQEELTISYLDVKEGTSENQDELDNDSSWEEVPINAHNLRNVDYDNGVFTYVFTEGGSNIVVNIKRKEYAQRNWQDIAF
jgi:hypothetical protein